MADPRGFLKAGRELPQRRPVDIRITDWREVTKSSPTPDCRRRPAGVWTAVSRFCHNGCPLGNLIPEWNDLVWRDDWRGAIERLHATNNFPEFTGRLCPAPCERRVLGINQPVVTIKQVEVSIIDKAWDGLGPAQPPARQSGAPLPSSARARPVSPRPSSWRGRPYRRRPGARRPDRGLLRYGIPEFKMEAAPDRRLQQMEAGVRFRPGRHRRPRHHQPGGPRTVRRRGAGRGRHPVARPAGPGPGTGQGAPGDGVPPLANRVCEGDSDHSDIDVAGKHVVIIGGGDTGADCLGTSHRQGAASVTQLEIMPLPSEDRPSTTMAHVSAHLPREQCPRRGRRAAVLGVHAALRRRRQRSCGRPGVGRGGDGRRPVHASARQRNGRSRRTSSSRHGLHRGRSGPWAEQFGVELDARGNVRRHDDYTTDVPGVFVAGDAGRGQSLIVWAIAEGQAAAASVDAYLSGGRATCPCRSRRPPAHSRCDRLITA